ncbi:hypothetical protein, partial [Escherichia coli]|uniref:hypothetical protein n=1 Tax=Escherichia coli TaxID=562 RepID=UPI0019D58A1E
ARKAEPDYTDENFGSLDLDFKAGAWRATEHQGKCGDNSRSVMLLPRRRPCSDATPAEIRRPYPDAKDL